MTDVRLLNQAGNWVTFYDVEETKVALESGVVRIVHKVDGRAVTTHYAPGGWRRVDAELED